jgi:hypothetical protein
MRQYYKSSYKTLENFPPAENNKLKKISLMARNCLECLILPPASASSGVEEFKFSFQNQKRDGAPKCGENLYTRHSHPAITT